MKKISLIILIILSILFSIFLFTKYKHESNIEKLLKLTYSNQLSFNNINCTYFFKEKCSINKLHYSINNNEIYIDNIFINNIYDIKDIINKSLKIEEIKNFNIIFNNITIKSFDENLNNFFNNYNNNLKVDITMINNENTLYSQTKLNMNLGIFSIKNKLNLTESQNKSIINDNELSISFINQELFDLMYLDYLNNFNSTDNKLKFNSLYNINSENLIHKDVFINNIKSYKNLLIKDINNPFLPFFNDKNQLIVKLENLFETDKEDFYIKFTNKDKIETSVLLESFNYFLINKKLPPELKNIEINIF